MKNNYSHDCPIFTPPTVGNTTTAVDPCTVQFKARKKKISSSSNWASSNCCGYPTVAGDIENCTVSQGQFDVFNDEDCAILSNPTHYNWENNVATEEPIQGRESASSEKNSLNNVEQGTSLDNCNIDEESKEDAPTHDDAMLDVEDAVEQATSSSNSFPSGLYQHRQHQFAISRATDPAPSYPYYPPLPAAGIYPPPSSQSSPYQPAAIFPYKSTRVTQGKSQEPQPMEWPNYYPPHYPPHYPPYYPQHYAIPPPPMHPYYSHQWTGSPRETFQKPAQKPFQRKKSQTRAAATGRANEPQSRSNSSNKSSAVEFGLGQGAATDINEVQSVAFIPLPRQASPMQSEFGDIFSQKLFTPEVTSGSSQMPPESSQRSALELNLDAHNKSAAADMSENNGCAAENFVKCGNDEIETQLFEYEESFRMLSALVTPETAGSEGKLMNQLAKLQKKPLLNLLRMNSLPGSQSTALAQLRDRLKDALGKGQIQVPQIIRQKNGRKSKAESHKEKPKDGSDRIPNLMNKTPVADIVQQAEAQREALSSTIHTETQHQSAQNKLNCTALAMAGINSNVKSAPLVEVQPVQIYPSTKIIELPTCPEAMLLNSNFPLYEPLLNISADSPFNVDLSIGVQVSVLVQEYGKYLLQNFALIQTLPKSASPRLIDGSKWKAVSDDSGVISLAKVSAIKLLSKSSNGCWHELLLTLPNSTGQYQLVEPEEVEALVEPPPLIIEEEEEMERHRPMRTSSKHVKCSNRAAVELADDQLVKPSINTDEVKSQQQFAARGKNWDEYLQSSACFASRRSSRTCDSAAIQMAIQESLREIRQSVKAHTPVVVGNPTPKLKANKAAKPAAATHSKAKGGTITVEKDQFALYYFHAGANGPVNVIKNSQTFLVEGNKVNSLLECDNWRTGDYFSMKFNRNEVIYNSNKQQSWKKSEAIERIGRIVAIHPADQDMKHSLFQSLKVIWYKQQQITLETIAAAKKSKPTVATTTITLTSIDCFDQSNNIISPWQITTVINASAQHFPYQMINQTDHSQASSFADEQEFLGLFLQHCYRNSFGHLDCILTSRRNFSDELQSFAADFIATSQIIFQQFQSEFQLFLEQQSNRHLSNWNEVKARLEAIVNSSLGFFAHQGGAINDQQFNKNVIVLQSSRVNEELVALQRESDKQAQILSLLSAMIHDAIRWLDCYVDDYGYLRVELLQSLQLNWTFFPPRSTAAADTAASLCTDAIRSSKQLREAV
jgi:hypothetical protein